MEIKKNTIRDILQKVGLPKLVLLVLTGIILLVLSFPSGESDSDTVSETEETTEQNEAEALEAMEAYARQQEEDTKNILSKVEGIGEVEVMVTLAASEEKIALQDDDVSDDTVTEEDQQGGTREQSSYSSKKESVLVEEDGTENPYVIQVNAPSVEGVVVVAEGADSGQIKKEIIEAIQALFPIEAHKIKVMKMK
ncbi:MAG: stage III sporulation protein AG [Clostridiaceae bacterium]|nr:stage III sporulation protein AG [Clostridiaceae bacterium]